MILTIANSQTDLYYSFVFDLMEERGKKPILFCADKCLEKEYIGFRIINNKISHYAIINNDEINLEKIESVWFLHPHLPEILRNMHPPEYRSFVQKQFLTTWQSLADLLKDKIWVSPYWNMIRAENKLYQLSIASKIGLEVPDTLISSDPKEVKEFWDYCKHEMIIKLLAVSVLEDHVIYTNKITLEDMAKIENVKYSPSIFQRYVPKKFELRIIIVGNKVFSIKIDSQKFSKTQIDWRRKPENDKEIYFSETTLPFEIKGKCLELTKQLGLRFGCIDMILTPDNRYIFLEINPNGQWWFAQTNTGLPIAEAIVDLLCTPI